MEQPKLRDWTPGCYGLRYPATVAGADALIYRRRSHPSSAFLDHGDIDVLVGTRGPGRWAAGMHILTFGGFIDPTDLSPWYTVSRELREELGEQMVVEIAPTPSIVTGPVKYCHIWDSKRCEAISTGVLAQDIPAITLFYLAEWKRGKAQPTEEVPAAEWWNLKRLLTETREYAFDHARVLEVFMQQVPKL